MADMDDDTTIILAEGMTNARAFREMLPLWQELRPELQLDPPDMREQLRQALNTRRAWSLTCYGAILLIFLFLLAIYMLVTFIESHVHH
jgi:ferric-dicitrate binding protein FerR (iron transport regulator)